MREISTQTIIDAVKASAMKANFELGDDVVKAFRDGIEKEVSPVGKDILNQQKIENEYLSLLKSTYEKLDKYLRDTFNP